MLCLIEDTIKFPHYYQQHLPSQIFSAAQINNHKFPQAQALICRSKVKINADLLTRAPSLKFIACPVAGKDHINEGLLNTAGINWVNAPACNATAVASYVLSVLAGTAFLEALIHGDKQIGIIGYGNIGKQLAQNLIKLGAKCRVYDPLVSDIPAQLVVSRLDEILACDIVSVHCNLHHQQPHASFNLLDQEQLALLRRPQLLINSARGEIVNQAALCARLKQPDAPFAVLDVWQGEPNINQNLAQDLLLLTPHIAGHTPRAYWQGEQQIYAAFCQSFGLSAQAWQQAPQRLLISPAQQPWQIQQQIINSFAFNRPSHAYQREVACLESHQLDCFTKYREKFATRSELEVE